MNYGAISEVIKGGTYYSLGSHTRFVVEDIAWYAHDCSVPFVVFRNVEPTFDKPVGHLWVLEESLFLKRYLEPL